MFERTYLCPLSCEERYSAAALSGHMRMHAGRLSDETRALYAKHGIPVAHADKAETETLWRMAYAYKSVTRLWPRWQGIDGPMPVAPPAWV